MGLFWSECGTRCLGVDGFLEKNSRGSIQEGVYIEISYTARILKTRVFPVSSRPLFDPNLDVNLPKEKKKKKKIYFTFGLMPF